MRNNNRKPNQLRDIQIKSNVNMWAEGSVEIFMGNTHLVCTASVSETTPKWLNKAGQGWVTAEYGMLPRSGDFRMSRERGFNSGRSQEISRLIARSLRAVVDLSQLGERMIHVDCDVLQADGGTRTAAITGGFVALSLALNHLTKKSLIKTLPLKNYVSAVSVGILDSKIFLDLDCKEDQSCETDMNFVMTDENQFIEIQGTAEKKTFSQNQLSDMIEVAQSGCKELFKKQSEIISPFFEKK